MEFDEVGVGEEADYHENTDVEAEVRLAFERLQNGLDLITIPLHKVNYLRHDYYRVVVGYLSQFPPELVDVISSDLVGPVSDLLLGLQDIEYQQGVFET